MKQFKFQVDSDDDRRRRPTRLTDLIANEASLVDSSANSDCRVVLYKRDDDPYRQGSSTPTVERGGSETLADPFESTIAEEPNIEGSSNVEDFDDDLGLGITQDYDTGKWYLADADGRRLAGPFMEKEDAQR